jgi:hypothetical protein
MSPTAHFRPSAVLATGGRRGFFPRRANEPSGLLPRGVGLVHSPPQVVTAVRDHGGNPVLAAAPRMSTCCKGVNN